MPRQNPAKLTKVSVGLPFGMGEAEWTDDPTERRAAWSLYVELVTRIAVRPMAVDEGSIREALASLYSLFDSTREILREAGPDVGAGEKSVGGIAIRVLNRGVRPFLNKWHIRLRDWESRSSGASSAVEHERSWSDSTVCRTELDKLRSELGVYADALGKLAGVEK